ncbi:ATP-binding protein [Ideonella paludis]|uniref:ATP-binding protein n=1 Tax=Ideonella paludis TaxID=1233411 RepID=UPI003639B2BA
MEDDGPGVTADQLPRLFEPFWRGERADLRNDSGTGLGLAIAREIVLRLGATACQQPPRGRRDALCD